MEKINIGALIFKALSTEAETPSRVALVDGHWVYVTNYRGECKERTSSKDLFLFLLEGELHIDFKDDHYELGNGEGLRIPGKTAWTPVTVEGKSAVALHFESRN